MSDLRWAHAVLGLLEVLRMNADICSECGSGILDGEHIAYYPCSSRVKSIHGKASNEATEGDERNRGDLASDGLGVANPSVKPPQSQTTNGHVPAYIYPGDLRSRVVCWFIGHVWSYDERGRGRHCIRCWRVEGRA